MNTTVRLVFFLLYISATTAYGQLFPADGASLNYTQVMFDHEANTNASYYKLFIEPVDKTGNQSADAPMEFQSVSPALLVKTGLQFGKKYEWRYEAFLKNGEIKGYGPYSFFIAALPQQQNSNTCFTITKKITTAIADDIIFFDNPAVAINRQGEMIWYLPMDTAELKAKDKIRNLHLTPFGSLLYLSPNGISEKTIDGKPLWNGPENTGTAGIGKDIYHHDCQMLPDGSFLVCDYEYVNEQCTFSPADTCQVRYNTLLQINKSGKIIWEWNEKGQADMEDFYAKKNPAIRKTEGTHMNGFGYDTATKSLALSFRNNSRIAKINKETGKLIWSLKPNAGNILYGSQHGAFFTKAGEVLFYNNQAIERGEAITRKEKAVSTPTIIIVKEKENNQPPLKVWEYSCATPAFPNGVRAKEGYAAEQPNGNILVCMGGANRTFEVTRKKELVWECFYEKMDTIKNIWLPQSSYRNHSASSLFPYYFSLQKNSDVVVAQAVSFQLFNDGSNDDTYTISMDTQKGYFKKGVQVIRLKAGEAKQILVPFFKSNAVQKGQHPLQVIVHVSAGNGIGQKKIISFDWK